MTLLILGSLLRSGIVKNRMGVKNKSERVRQKVEMTCGMIIVCILRYLCHTIAGATVWAGLSIPDGAALIYSIGYNATYMIPETIVAALVAFWIADVIDFSKNVPVRFPASSQLKDEKYATTCEVLPHISRFLLLFAVGFDTVIIAPHLQDAESGEFTFANMGDVNWILIGIVTAVCVFLAASAMVVLHYIGKAKTE